MPTATGCMPRFQDPRQRASGHHDPELSDPPERAHHPGRFLLRQRQGGARAAGVSRRAMAVAGTAAEAGVKPEDIDIVLCSHLHVDHVGWNTRLDNGRWVPTFPNARYLISRREWDYWQRGRAWRRSPAPATSSPTACCRCSQSGQADLVGDEHAVASEHLDRARARPYAGPDDGAARLRPRAGDPQRRPDAPSAAGSLSGWSTRFCADPGAGARRPASDFFNEHANTGG